MPSRMDPLEQDKQRSERCCAVLLLLRDLPGQLSFLFPEICISRSRIFR